MKEKTIQNTVSCSGVGLHSGREIHMTLRPAEKGRGIVFVRKDMEGTAIPADAAHVVPSSLATILE
ncbi:MAG: UDP-3-O-acyl-N-acetylglucosamine deacetylase, partial [Nitrospiria bacterium]